MVWQIIKDFQDYLVSPEGQIKSIKKDELILAQRLNDSGYLLVDLCMEVKVSTKRVHRLVAEAFCFKLIGKNEVNHKNEIKTDNRSINLEWCDRSYNNNYGLRNELSARKLRKPVKMYDLKGNYIKSFDSLTQASKDGFSIGSISRVMNGKVKSTKGYVFKRS